MTDQAIRVLTTVPFDLPPIQAEPPDEWPRGVDVLDRRRMSMPTLLRRLVDGARKYDAVLLNGSGRFDQAVAALVARLPGRARLVLDECVWDVGSSVLDRAACRVGLRMMADPRTTFCVLSSDETEMFPRTWHVDPQRVAFTPYCHTLSRAQLEAPTAQGGGIFAGGDSMRDYGPLTEAARRVHVAFTFAVQETRFSGTQLPPNVTAGAVSRDEFFRHMRDADAVVVAMQPGVCRSAGQQTYLNGMALGKLVIATDSPGVHDYIEDRTTGLIVPAGDADAMTSAIEWALDPRNHGLVSEMTRRAREVARAQFSPARHVQRLFDVVSRAVEEAA